MVIQINCVELKWKDLWDCVLAGHVPLVRGMSLTSDV